MRAAGRGRWLALATAVVAAALVLAGCKTAGNLLRENAAKIAQAVGHVFNSDDIEIGVKTLARGDLQIADALSVDIARLVAGSASRERVTATSQDLAAWFSEKGRNEDVSKARDLLVTAFCSAKDQLIAGTPVDLQSVLADEIHAELHLDDRRAEFAEAQKLLDELTSDSADSTVQVRAVAYAVCLAK